MSIDYFKYDLYRKYQTSDGVTYTPLDEYQAVMTDYQMNDDCGFINYANLYYGGIDQTQYPNGTKFRQFKIINNRKCMPQIVDNKNYNGEGGGTVIYGGGTPIYYRYDFYGGREYELLGIQNKDITDLSKAFYGCDNLYKADLNNWDISSVTTMSEIFRGCPLYNGLEIDNWDTSSVTTMSKMFYLCRFSKLDISKWNTSNVTDMSYMFNDCTNLTSLDLSNFDITNVTSMSGMFDGCNELNHIKCKQAFKDWCITNQDTIKLPDSMKEGGSGTWEIV